ncbi:heme peroxidase 4 [Pyrrhoderma noxium]|uniref:Heme peroxidase 4 n=1 Tax=Pyrrhoderma noxium TaxID=2282107 RepID=A0A286UH46_9AGAM|nr:heme peroxidase 4 [Pyrrhoderma noxium]
MPRTDVSKKLTDADIEAAFPSSPRHVRVTANIVTVTSSDGNISNLPEESEEECSPDGEVDYQSLAEKVDVDHWLSSLGDYLIYSNNHLKPSNMVSAHYKLDRFPDGYKLFIHRKGPKSDPRRDHYLYGSSSERCRKFRSPEEFALHLLWLAHGQPRDKKEFLKTKTNRSRVKGKRTQKSKSKSTHTEPSKIFAKDYTGLNQGQGVRPTYSKPIYPLFCSLPNLNILYLTE